MNSRVPSALSYLGCVLLSACAHALDHGRAPLAIEALSGEVHQFQVEVADSTRERRRGLMFRDELPAGHGMLFDFRRNAPVSMWMVNTLIPLDIIFIGEDGAIVSITESAEPLSGDRITSGEPVRAVLEVNAGVAGQLGIRPGDRVVHPIFGRSFERAQRRGEAVQ
jgi:uncharacterized membrane protein (UPF0127 family)